MNNCCQSIATFFSAVYYCLHVLICKICISVSKDKCIESSGGET
jgi:hypothetical protein